MIIGQKVNELILVYVRPTPRKMYGKKGFGSFSILTPTTPPSATDYKPSSPGLGTPGSGGSSSAQSMKFYYAHL